MNHVAIMNKKWKLIPKILSGEKIIESRWSKHKISPWGKVKLGETVYFKNAGEKIEAKAIVKKVELFDNLDERKIRWIIENRKGIAFSNSDNAFSWAKGKSYCILVYLKNPQKVKPFGINKKGFGTGAAWLCVEDIKRISLPDIAV